MTNATWRGTTVRTLGVCALLPILAGCLNPRLINSTSGGIYPAVPGDQPFVLVRVINNTDATLTVPVGVDEGDGETILHEIDQLSPAARESAVIVGWPVARIGIGDLDQPFDPVIVATYPDGTTVSVPYGQGPLVAGVNFTQGDGIVFLFSGTGGPASLRLSIARVPGSDQPTAFSGRDTFQILTFILAQNGLLMETATAQTTP